MKKLITIAVVAIMMFVMGTVSAFAEISPTAKPETDKPGGSGSTTSPQTADSAVVLGSLGVMMTAAASVLAVKKIKE
ncbi:MAG: hypothetical protein IJO20_07535 [Ruminococcus sp.]|nr:hypothetical protein [Ruminococcus sp.]MBQ7134331.1 hypothetical protein [Ruminococcus sp.]